MSGRKSLTEVVRDFAIEGELTEAQPYGSGHINDSYRIECRGAQGADRYLLQRINTSIFKDVGALMGNVERVTHHLARKVEGDNDALRRVLRLMPTRDGRKWLIDDGGAAWRMYRFIESARTYDAVQSPEQAFEAASAFGRFQEMLVDLPAPRLNDTIPDFHHTPKRHQALERAIIADAVGRVARVGEEIAFVRQRTALTRVLHEAGLPERITHNDTKFNNVMLDDATGKAMCVVDLDTVMPGLALHDFGDMVRTTTSPTQEDEIDLSRVGMQMPMFEALLRGYLSTAGAFLMRAEKALLVTAGKVIALEQGIRFLTDYVGGDTYYKVHREGQNLDRCRTQLKLVASIEEQEDGMEALLHSLIEG